MGAVEGDRILGSLAPIFILTLNVNCDKLPPLPVPTGPTLNAEAGLSGLPHGSLSLLPQGS